MMRKIATRVILFFILALFLVPSASYARMGVGVGTGKIEFDKPLKPGSLYTLPPMTVINTGDEAGDYGVSIEYQEGQSTISPPQEWFIFIPDSFHLDASQSQVVEVQANIPIKVAPGDYFAFLSAHPVEKVDAPNGTKVGISAATKMYFTVAPANFISGVFYRLNSLWKKYTPWTYIVSALLLLSIATVILRRFITLNISIGKMRKKIEKSTTINAVDKSEEMYAILTSAIRKVEGYAAQLSERKFEQVFIEAKAHKQGIIDFFYKNDSRVLYKTSPELKNILMLSKNGLDEVKYRGKDVYEKILKMVVLGMIE